MLTIALCTYNRGKLAIQALGSALPQLPEGGEVVVVDQSKDGSELEAFCKGDTRIRYERITYVGLTNARNVALARARGEYIYYLDDDAKLVPGALAAHLDAIAKPGVGASTGPIFDHG